MILAPQRRLIVPPRGLLVPSRRAPARGPRWLPGWLRPRRSRRGTLTVQTFSATSCASCCSSSSSSSSDSGSSSSSSSGVCIETGCCEECAPNPLTAVATYISGSTCLGAAGTYTLEWDGVTGGAITWDSAGGSVPGWFMRLQCIPVDGIHYWLCTLYYSEPTEDPETNIVTASGSFDLPYNDSDVHCDPFELDYVSTKALFVCNDPATTFVDPCNDDPPCGTFEVVITA